MNKNETSKQKLDEKVRIRELLQNMLKKCINKMNEILNLAVLAKLNEGMFTD